MSEAADLQRIRLDAAKRADGQTAGIYAITCAVTGRFYVGSSRRLAARLSRHRRDLRAGKHHCIPLQRAWNKYGEAAFSIDILMVTTVTDDLLVWEQDYLSADYLRPHLFNTCFVAGSCAGVQHSEETRAKRAASLRGSRRTPEQRARISEARKAVGISVEHQRRLNEFSAARAFRLSSSDAAVARDARLGGATMDEIAARLQVSQNVARRELLRHFPDLVGMNAKTRRVELAPPRPEKERKRAPKPWLAERNKARIWTDEMRRKLSDARRARPGSDV